MDRVRTLTLVLLSALLLTACRSDAPSTAEPTNEPEEQAAPELDLSDPRQLGSAAAALYGRYKAEVEEILGQQLSGDEMAQRLDALFHSYVPQMIELGRRCQELTEEGACQTAIGALSMQAATNFQWFGSTAVGLRESNRALSTQLNSMGALFQWFNLEAAARNFPELAERYSVSVPAPD
ncbi:MAG: hypothetical protein KC561_20940 [Myxococcales bacterium]|nr:hypothetical protein [Myxococcales bacterium]